MASSPITSWWILGGKVTDFIFLGSKITMDGDCSHKIKRHLLLGRKARINLDSVLKSKDITSLTKDRMYSYGFPVVIFNVNWCFWILVLDKTLESPLDCKEIKSVKPKENQPWIFIGMTGAEAPIFWPPDAKSPLIRKDAYAGKDWRQRRSGQQRVRLLDSITDSMDMNLKNPRR